MNHIYKVVWSTVTNSLVVVSELARSKGKAASTVSDVKDVSNKTAAVAVAAALQVAAVGTIAIGSFAPMEANAIIAIGHAENGQIDSSTAQANASKVDRSAYGIYTTTDDGTRPYNYNNPGSLSYNNPNSKPTDRTELYDNNLSHGIAIGCHTNVIATTGKGGSNGIAIGDYAQATGGLSVSLGAFSKSTDVGAMALGTSSRASGFNSLAMMRQSAATGDYAVAIGSVAYAKGNSSFAMGSSATAMGNQSIAIGSVAPKTLDATDGFEAKRTDYDGVNNTQTNGERSLAIGSAAKTNGDDSFAVGTSARTGYFDNKSQSIKGQSADKAIAFGNDSKALKDKAVAFGNNASAKGEESVAFAFNSTSVGNQSVAIGTNSNAAHDRVVTIGTNSTATHNRSMAIGEEAKAKANHSLALGANAIVTVENSVSLGADSNADEIGGQGSMVVNGRTYNFAGLTPKGTVSVGSGYDGTQARPGTVVRTITDVGAGRVSATSTDAINGSQLYALTTEIEKGWNVATGATNEGTHSGDVTNKVISGETVKFVAGKNIAIDQQAKNITVKTEDDVTFTNVKSNTVNAGDLTVTGNTNVNNLTVKPGAKIDMGGNTVTNISAPTNAKDATNKEYVDNGRTQVESTDKSVTITNSTTSTGAKVYDLKVNADLNYAGDTGTGTNKLSDKVKFSGTTDQIETVAKDGDVNFKLAKKVTDSLDKADSAMQEFTVGADKAHTATGIKVNQTTNRFDIIGTDKFVNTTVTGTSVQVDIAQDFKDTVSNNTQNIADNEQNITNNANNITKNAQDIAKGFGLEAEDGKTVNKKLGENVSVVGANSNIKTSVDEGKVKIALNNTLDLTAGGSVKTGATTVNGNGLTIANGPSVTKTGINAGNQKITNVTNGTISETSTDAVNGSQLHATNQNVTKNATDITNLNNTVQSGWELQVEGTKAKDVTPKDRIANFKAGDNIVVTNDSGSVKIATKKDVTFDNVKADKGLTVKNGATINMGDNVVNGVANGEVSSTSKQAVNGSQLYQTNQNVTNLANVVDGGFGLKAQNGATVDKKLGEKAEIIGGNKNINTTVTNDGKLAINLNNTLDLGDKGSVTTGNTTVNNEGVTIKAAPGKTEVSLTNKGLNNGGNTITNVAAGVNKTDAVNVEQLDKVNATANAGWVLQANKDKATESTVKPNQTVSLNNTDNNIVISKSKDDNNVTFGLSNTVKVGTGNTQVTIDGTKGIVNGLTNKTFNPDSIVSGQAATEDQLKQVSDTVNNNINNVDNTLSKKGLNFVGDNKGEVVHRDLGATLSVIGGAEENNLSDKNIGVVGNQDGSLTVKLAKTLKDLTNATFTTAGNNGNTVIDGKGVTITPANGGADKTVSLTDKGLNNGGNTITNVAAGVNKTDAVNVSQLEKVNATAKAGWNLAVNNDEKSNIAPNATVRLNNKDGNIKIAKDANNNVTFDLNDTVNIGSGDKKVTIDGTKGTVNGLTNRTFDPKNIVNGQAATEDQLKQVHGDLNTNITNASNDLINKGLSFVGDNTATKVHRKLGETLSVVGNADVNKLSDKNIGVVGNAQGELVVKLAKELTDLTSANFTATGANTTINGNGVTIKPATGGDAKTVSLTDKGLNNGGNNITNVANGTADTDAVNVSQLKAVSSTANAGWNLTVNGTSSSNVAPKATVDLANKDGNIVITKDNNNVTFALNSNLTVGGKDGKDGSIGVNGKDGSAVVLNGKDGSIGLTGPKGADGKDGAKATITVAKGPVGVDGKDGANGTDGMTRIVYTDPNGTKHNVSTLNDGLSFVGNTGGAVAKKLNETLTIKGELANADAATAENIRVDNVNGDLIVKLAQNLTNLTTATFGKDVNDQLVINKDGLTIKPTTGGNAQTVSLTENGLNNGNNIITNVSSGLVGNDGNKVALKDANGTTLTNAVNVGDLQNTVKDLTNATTGGFGLKDSAGNEVKQDLGTSIKVTGKDGVNAQVVTDGNGKALQIGLNSTVTVGDKDKPGTITVKGENGKDGVSINGKDGTIGLNGKDGANGSITVKNGQPGVDGKDGKTTTEEVATLNDGLKFVGDKGEVIAKKLNETLVVKGNLDENANVTDKNLRVDNEKGELIIKMAKELKDLTNATFTSADSNTTIGGNGVTITPNKGDKVSLTDKGLNNGNNQITNVTSGLTDATGNKADLTNAVDTNAVNVGDLKETVKNITTDGFGLKDDKGTEVKQDLGKTIQIKGKDGVTVTADAADKALVVALEGDVVVNGKDGKDGTIGVKGVDGKDGTTITKDAIVFNGVDGVNGKDGKDGAEGKASIKVEKGAKGIDGNDGKDGESKTRIVYEKPNGDKEEVATLKDGLHFVGDNGDVIAKKLNETLAIKGNLTSTAEVTDKNLRVDNEGGQLIVKMAKVLTDLTSANFTDAAGNNTIIGGNGVTITPKAGDSVSLTGKGLNNGNNTITNVKAGLNGTDAVNVNQLEKVNATAKAGWKLTNNGTNESTVTPNATVDLANKDGNILITKDGNNVTFGFNNDLTVGGPGKDGKDGKDGSIGVKGKDGTTGVTLNGKDGSIGLTGPKGADGKSATATITVAKGPVGVDGKDGANGTDGMTRIVYTDPNGTKHNVSTLNDGLNFVGNDGKVIAKKLNKTLAITGGINTEAGLTAASDRNVGVRKNNDGLNIVIAERPTFSGIIVDGKDGKDAEVKFAKDGKDGMSIVGTRGADGQNGLTLKGADGKDGVSFKEDGRITNVADGKDGKDAVNKDQLERVNATANAGWKLTINNGNNQTTVTPNATVDLANTDGNIVITKVGNNVNFGLNNTLTVGNDNKPGTMTVKGENGKDGVSISGKDGISIKGENGQDAVSINGKDGNGAIAVNGKDGKTGVGLDGANGTIGINGKDGSNGAITVEKGAVGVDGTDGANGKDGMTRIVYTDANGTKHNVSTLNDGLSFVGDTGNPIAKKLNQTLTIKGNLDAAAAVTDKNLRVDNVDGALIIKMARTLTDLTSATFTNAGGDKSVVDGNGLTITPANGGNTVSLTTNGLDNGGNKVINVADGDVSATSTDAVNGSQLYAVSEVANKGWNIQTNGNASTNVKPGDTVNFANGDNIKINNDGTKVTVGLVEDVDLGKDGSIKAGDTIMDNEGVKVGDKVSLTKDGLTAGDVKISAETGINAGNKQITNVESGLGGTKLADAKGDTLKNAANIGDLQTAISGVTDAEQGGGFGLADDNGTEVKQSLGKTIQVKGDGNVTTTVTNGSLTVGLNKDVDLGKDGSLTAGGTKVSEKGVSFADSLVNLTSDGLNNGGNKVINVKAGEVSATSTDAVNGSQLHATNQNVTNVQNTVAKGWNIEAGTVEGSTGKVTGASKSKVAMGDTVGMKAGNNIEITQDGSNIAIATSATPTFDTVTVGKDGNTATVGTVKDKHGSAIKVTGADGKSETRINNVADGKADNDAVNVRQLKGVAQNVANIDNRVSKLDKRVRGIGANSAAASSLPQVMLPGKSMVAVAGGAYSGASAVAVGYSRASDNGKVILKVNGTANSAGHYSGGVGVGFQW